MGTNSERPTTEESRARLKAELRVYYGSSQDKLLHGFSVDVSSGGLFLSTEIPFSVDEKLVLSFTLPDVDKVVTCKAKVAWVNLKDEPRKPELPPGIGLQFVDPSAEYMQSIQSLLKHNGVEPIS